ncbi:MAG: pyruvate kinase alpha/beta domain-containing protein [Thermodesulfovibrionales bacterium]
MLKKVVTYFEKPGRENTPACLNIVKDAIKEYGYKHIIIASTEGDTGLLFSRELSPTGINIVVITHCANFKGPNIEEFKPEVRREIESLGAKIHTGTMVTHSIETAFASKFHGLYPTLVVANTLRRFCEGVKVCCEIVMMATDAGLVPEGEEVLAVAGTGRGADTVTVIMSSASKRFFELKVLEILAKPRT